MCNNNPSPTASHSCHWWLHQASCRSNWHGCPELWSVCYSNVRTSTTRSFNLWPMLLRSFCRGVLIGMLCLTSSILIFLFRLLIFAAHGKAHHNIKIPKIRITTSNISTTSAKFTQIKNGTTENLLWKDKTHRQTELKQYKQEHRFWSTIILH